MMKLLVVLLFICLSTFQSTLLAKPSAALNALATHTWNSGSLFCMFNNDPEIEVFQYNETTYILRQNKCSHYEAPFIYVLFGKNSVFIQDTGAIASPNEFPLYDTVMKLVEKVALAANKAADDYSIIVSHSHSHSDHTAADIQFINKPNVTLISPTLEGVKSYFDYDDQKLNWPNDMTHLNLGERNLTIIPIPGHQTEALAIYDPSTQWLLTGDSLYPGRIYVKDWQSFQKSMERLVKFTQTKQVEAVLGTHIEMSKKPGRDYNIGSTFQPDEAPLPLTLEDLFLLNQYLIKHQSPQQVTTDNFIIYPVK